MTTPKPKRIKLTIVGDGATGKTCLLMVYKEEKFPQEYVATVFENYVKYLTYEGKGIELVLWDTAGQEDYDSIRPLSYPDTDVILLCYAIDQRESFDNIINKWQEELKQYCPKIPIVLVGTKKDLRSEIITSSDIENSNKVDFVLRDEGRKMSESISASAFVECSSLTGEAVNDVFESAIKATLQRRKKFKYRLRKYSCFIPV
ncbi:ras-like GTP-binding protein Rho1 [Xenia sp. Carnegie-2017]|uniref:ras-like GTP-binding protein Rho1 n=1 Tax=Xenia sp. Carnegie-2017 TaxID=2897299 RepID=UPI001F043A14|nr:ras-like GTP-binding protein Rho1 [Xenia sp. Carnegie-2017]